MNKVLKLIGLLLLMGMSPLQADHPLWVGYGSSENGRNPAISGKIDKQYIGQFLPPNPVVVEAGAYNGQDTLEMARKWPKGTIHAFEPMPYAFAILKKHCRKEKNIAIYSLALSDKQGFQTLYISSGASKASSSLLPPDSGMEKYHSDISFSQVVTVPTITLDQWADLVKVPAIDFLWLDMQGMEPIMLKASPRMLKTVKVILTEVSLKSVYEGTILYPDFKQWLEQEGFEAVREDIPWLDGGDVLFVRKK